MLELLTANWQLPAAAVGLLVILVPRLRPMFGTAARWLPNRAPVVSRHTLVDAWQLLTTSLVDDQEAAKALRKEVWPAIGEYDETL